MAALSDADIKRIETAVAALERRTSAELAIVVARRSRDYATYPFIWAAAAALVAGAALALAVPSALPIEAVLLEGAVFAIVYLALQFTPLGMALTPARIKQASARRLAAAQFASLVAQRTTDRAGVLLFVSLAEHHVEILADRRIDETVGREHWPAVIERFRAANGASVADRLLAAVDACAEILAARVPPQPGQRNEIPDMPKEL